MNWLTTCPPQKRLSITATESFLCLHKPSLLYGAHIHGRPSQSLLPTVLTIPPLVIAPLLLSVVPSFVLCVFLSSPKVNCYPLIYSQFQLFLVFMFYRVAVNTEVARTEPFIAPGGKPGAGFLGNSGHNTFINQPIHNLVVRMFLFTDNLFNI